MHHTHWARISDAIVWVLFYVTLSLRERERGKLASDGMEYDIIWMWYLSFGCQKMLKCWIVKSQIPLNSMRYICIRSNVGRMIRIVSIRNGLMIIIYTMNMQNGPKFIFVWRNFIHIKKNHDKDSKWSFMGQKILSFVYFIEIDSYYTEFILYNHTAICMIRSQFYLSKRLRFIHFSTKETTNA